MTSKSSKQKFINPWGKKYTLPPGGIQENYPSSLLDGLSPDQYKKFLAGDWPAKNKQNNQPR